MLSLLSLIVIACLQWQFDMLPDVTVCDVCFFRDVYYLPSYDSKLTTPARKLEWSGSDNALENMIWRLLFIRGLTDRFLKNHCQESWLQSKKIHFGSLSQKHLLLIGKKEGGLQSACLLACLLLILGKVDNNAKKKFGGEEISQLFRMQLVKLPPGIHWLHHVSTPFFLFVLKFSLVFVLLLIISFNVLWNERGNVLKPLTKMFGKEILASAAFFVVFRLYSDYQQSFMFVSIPCFAGCTFVSKVCLVKEGKKKKKTNLN